MYSVMTSGVAPRASKACTLRMDTTPTTLSEFVDGDAASDHSPTPEQNAADIQRLADCVETLTDQVNQVAATLEQRPAEYSAEAIDSDPHGMYQ